MNLEPLYSAVKSFDGSPVWRENLLNGRRSRQRDGRFPTHVTRRLDGRGLHQGGQGTLSLDRRLPCRMTRRRLRCADGCLMVSRSIRD